MHLKIKTLYYIPGIDIILVDLVDFDRYTSPQKPWL